MPVIDSAALYGNRVEAIRKFHADIKQPKAELDLSGGIDSAVMACLLVEALGKDNVLLVHTRINTNPVQTDRATRLAKALVAPFVNFDLTGFFDKLARDMGTALAMATQYQQEEVLTKQANDPTTLGSIRSTLRAPIGRGFNRMFGGGVRHGTGNECEDRFLRFYQKGGDGEVDTNPMEMLSKTEVYQLAFYIMVKASVQDGNYGLAQVMRETIEAKPSPDLWGQGDLHNDEDELFFGTGVPFTYGRIDVNTGKVLEFGTIERMARLLDTEFPNGTDEDAVKDLVEDVMFHRDLQDSDLEMSAIWPIIAQLSDKTGIFPSAMFTPEQVKAFIMAGRKAERATRHKSNANIPTLGTRQELLAAGILTNKLEV